MRLAKRRMVDNGLNSILIGTNNRISRYEVDGLESLQKAVGGYIEMLRPHQAIDSGLLKHDVILIVDEEGTFKCKEMNTIASALFGSPLVGDILIAKERGSEIVNFKENELKSVEKLCGKLLSAIGGYR